MSFYGCKNSHLLEGKIKAQNCRQCHATRVNFNKENRKWEWWFYYNLKWVSRRDIIIHACLNYERKKRKIMSLVLRTFEFVFVAKYLIDF